MKDALARRAHDEGISETRLVTRLIEEGLKTSAHPGIVYRDGSAGRRAAVAGGPDVWEVVVATRHTRKRGDARAAAAAEQLGVAERLVRGPPESATASWLREVPDRRDVQPCCGPAPHRPRS